MADTAVVGGAWLAGAAVFFRAEWTSSFHKLMGNDGDTRLIAYLCEHWFQVMHGNGSWRDPTFFYPVKGLLGWSDSFVLFEVFYAPLRVMGADPFLALQLTTILLSLVGYVAFVCLVRLAFGASRITAVITGLVFVFANNLWLHVASAQLSGVYLVPLVALLGLLSWRAAPVNRRRATVFGGASGLLAALLLFTTYYVAWFSFLAAAVAVLVWLAGSRGRLVRRVIPAMRRVWAPAVAAAIGFAVAIVPFLMTYIPARHKAVGTTYAQVLGYAARTRDIVNVGTGNLFWSSLLHHLDNTARLSTYEATYAVTPFLMLLVVGGGALAAWRLLTARAARPLAARAAAILATTTVVLVVLPLRTRIGTPWAIIWHIPGADAMRAIDRLEIVAGLVAVLAVVAAATDLAASAATWPRPTRIRFAGTVLLLVALAEQVNTSPVAQVNRPTQLALLSAVPSPPKPCRSFFVSNSKRAHWAYFEYQIDAMLISQKLSLPTLNGYTGYNPAGWDLEHPDLAGYQASVAAWAVSNGITSGLCRLDLGTMTWEQGGLALSAATTSGLP